MNVEFFVDDVSVGVDTTANPYSTITSNLTAGTYVLSAVATDNTGGTDTSSIVITVVDSTVSLSQQKFLDGQFQFSISDLLSGKTNLIQTPTNLLDWTSVRTNVATGDSVTFTNTLPTGVGPRFFPWFTFFEE